MRSMNAQLLCCQQILIIIFLENGRFSLCHDYELSALQTRIHLVHSLLYGLQVKKWRNNGFTLHHRCAMVAPPIQMDSW